MSDDDIMSDDNIINLFGLRDIKREQEEKEILDSMVVEQSENSDEMVVNVPTETIRVMARRVVNDFFDHSTLTIGQRILARPYIEDLVTGLTAVCSLKLALGIELGDLSDSVLPSGNKC